MYFMVTILALQIFVYFPINLVKADKLDLKQS